MSRKNIVIFLDIDGVLNNEQVLKNNGALGALDSACLRLLDKLVENTGANIVITSTWRLGHSLYWLQHMFERNGFHYPERMIGTTMNLSGKPRRDEINLWLKQVPVDAFVIIDDDGDASIDGHFVCTSFSTGMTGEHCDKAEKLLAEQLEER
jgi:hypothetical protein